MAAQSGAVWKDDGHPLPWQEAVAQEILSSRRCADSLNVTVRVHRSWREPVRGETATVNLVVWQMRPELSWRRKIRSKCQLRIGGSPKSVGTNLC
jgi:hypothetical protein